MGVEAGWLAARRAADDAAREATVGSLLPRLIADLDRRGADEVRLIDVGAGSGANQRWLAPRLPVPQRWVHLDHDPAILMHTHDVGPTDFVVGGIDALAGLLDADATATVITCAAVLDVLTRTDLDALAGLIRTYDVPSLFSLSVTGELVLDPPEVSDERLLAAFNAHQRRDGRAGPDAPDLLTGWCRIAGVGVVAVETPWLLDAGADPGFVGRFLTERVAASVEQEPRLADAATAWTRARSAQLAAGNLRVRVGHRDLLLLPSN
ncbi:hypothetical protein [Microlunatus ginsengisoli]|uniref:hypothetical protein n=1 Tax=Microlunatus ginsengisoli TaxID=363863 RepID=UPI0031D6D775